MVAEQLLPSLMRARPRARSPTNSLSTPLLSLPQVALWTSVMLGLTLLGTLWFMLSTAEDGRDPQVFSQILVDPRSGGKGAGGGGGGAAAASAASR